MNDPKEQWDAIFAAHKQRSEQYMQLLPRSGDISLVVLKGHLIVEEMLFEIAAAHCSDRDALERAKLTFAQLLCVTQALVKLSVGDAIWPAAAALNSMRNALVHNLNPSDLEKRIKGLQDLCKLDDSLFPPGYVPPSEPAEVVATCISFIMGALSVVGPVSEVFERGMFRPTQK